MSQPDFHTFRTYLEEAEGEEIAEPSAEQLTTVEFWWSIGGTFLRYLDRRIEDSEPFEWYEHFLDKTIEALQYAHELMEQGAFINIPDQIFLPRDLAETYATRGRTNMAQGAYNAAFLDFDAALSYQREAKHNRRNMAQSMYDAAFLDFDSILNQYEAEYENLRIQALSHLPQE